MAEQPMVLQRTEGQLFRERMGFIIICIIGLYCAMRLLVELKSILEPLFWAVFLLMAIKPVVDLLEKRIEVCLERICGCNPTEVPRDAERRRSEEDPELQRMLGPPDASGAESDGGSPVFAARLAPSVAGGSSDEEELLPFAGESRPSGRAARLARNEAAGDRCVDGVETRGRCKTTARGVAVVLALFLVLSVMYWFGCLILESARHMRDHWDVYRKGAANLASQSEGCMGWILRRLPENVKLRYEDVTADMIKAAQDILYGLLGELLNNISSLLLGAALTMLYTLFFLCSPIPMDAAVDGMFRRFILMKTLACLGYGVCTGSLLAFLSVDLASVFGLTTFVLNYVPEVGAFVAMVLPCPVILLDSRLERPLLNLVLAIGGQLALKFAFSNIIEVKLIESDRKLRMHPVMILLSVGVFGHLWGPTGMLLSVPLMAFLKLSLFSDIVPASYRDPILVLIEGDRNAPRRHGLKQHRRGRPRGASPPAG